MRRVSNLQRYVHARADRLDFLMVYLHGIDRLRDLCGVSQDQDVVANIQLSSEIKHCHSNAVEIMRDLANQNFHRLFLQKSITNR
jgi:hypothetical protein